MFKRLRRWRVRTEDADKGNHFDDHGLVVVQKSGQRLEPGDLATELFLDFANNGGGGGFAGFNFSAGKLPFVGEMFMGWSLGDEQPAIFFDEGANNRNGRRGSHAIRWPEC